MTVQRTKEVNEEIVAKTEHLTGEVVVRIFLADGQPTNASLAFFAGPTRKGFLAISTYGTLLSLYDALTEALGEVS